MLVNDVVQWKSLCLLKVKVTFQTMQKGDNSKPSMNKDERKRGRPSGKNRVPLSAAERRARNAQYERERRIETAEAMAHLAEAAGCDPQITNPELLATVINRLQNKEEKSIDDLKRINAELESQIATLQGRLEGDPSFEANLDLHSKELGTTSRIDEHTSSHSACTSDTRSSEDRRPTKYLKSSKRNEVHDNAKRSSSSSRPKCSTDSQDSDWSHHDMGKTLPSQAMPQLTTTITFQPSSITGHDTESTSSYLERTDSMSSECSQANPMRSRLRVREEFYSENSELSAALSEKSTQQDVRVEIQLVPDLNQIKTETVGDQTKIEFIDPFTDGEKAVLERLGWSDFINFGDTYNENQTNVMWAAADYAGF